MKRRDALKLPFVAGSVVVLGASAELPLPKLAYDVSQVRMFLGDVELVGFAESEFRTDDDA